MCYWQCGWPSVSNRVSIQCHQPQQILEWVQRSFRHQCAAICDADCRIMRASLNTPGMFCFRILFFETDIVLTISFSVLISTGGVNDYFAFTHNPSLFDFLSSIPKPYYLLGGAGIFHRHSQVNHRVVYKHCLLFAVFFVFMLFYLISFYCVVLFADPAYPLLEWLITTTRVPAMAPRMPSIFFIRTNNGQCTFFLVSSQ